jgi:hypothetical protein
LKGIYILFPKTKEELLEVVEAKPPCKISSFLNGSKL